MRIVRRWLIYVQVQQDHFITRVVGGDRTIRRQCHAPSNRTGPIKDFCTLRPQLKTIFSELMPRFSLSSSRGGIYTSIRLSIRSRMREWPDSRRLLCKTACASAFSARGSSDMKTRICWACSNRASQLFI